MENEDKKLGTLKEKLCCEGVNDRDKNNEDSKK